MKKLIYLLFIVAAGAFIFNSCSEDYLETAPTDQISDATAFSTVKNAWGTINGIHRSLYTQYNAQGEGGIAGTFINNEVMGEDFVMTSAGNGWYNNMYKYINHRNETNRECEYPWRVYYKLNANANMIINNIDGAEGDPTERDIIKGQALFYRAFCHYQIVQLYAERYDGAGNNSQPGIPIMVENTFDGVARSSVEEVYAQINSDLDDAIGFLDGYNRYNKSHINADVARGLKARVALTMQDWSTAATYANQVISGSDFALMDSADYTTGFNDYNNDEWMWGSHLIEEQTIYFYSFFAYVSRNFSSTNIRTNPKAISTLLYAQIPATDVRKVIFDPTGLHTAIGLPSNFTKFPYTSQKFLAYGGADSRGDVPYMRLAEMYLIAAEAQARMGGQDAAARQTLFNLVTTRDGAYTLSTNSGQALIDEILIQRRIELWGEGFRFLDLKRTNSALNRNGANHNASLIGGVFDIPAGSLMWQYLIPKAEVDANPLMEQNPLAK